MKRIKLTVAFFAILILSGCSHDLWEDTPSADYEKSDQPIKLNASYTMLTTTTDAGGSTRTPYMGEIGDNGPLQARVFASLDATSFNSPYEISQGRTMTFTAQGTAQGTAVGYSSPVYYPVDPTKQVRLAGFFPASDWTLNTSGGYDTFQATINGKNDLMASTAVQTDIDDAQNSPTIYKNLEFTHALTLLDLYVKAEGAAMITHWGNITSVEVVGVVYGAENLAPSTTVVWNATNNTYTYPVATGTSIPFYIYNSDYTDTPISSTPLTTTLTQIGYVMVPPVKVDKTGAISFGYELKITTPLKTVNVITYIALNSPTSVEGVDTRGKSFPVNLTFSQQVLSTYYKIPIPAEFIGDAPTLSTLLTTRTYVVYDPEDTEVDLTQRRRIAEIDLEYIRGYSDTAPAVVVYEMEYAAAYPNGRRKMTGTIANDGYIVNWTNSNYTNLYTPSSPAISSFEDFIYYDPAENGGDGAILYANPGGTLINWDPTAYTFKDWGGTLNGRDNEYPVVKIGRQYYIASNLRASTYPGGANMNVAPYANATAYSQIPGYNVVPSKPFYYDIDTDNTNDLKTFGYYYSEAVFTNGLFIPFNGWRVPLAGDNQLFDGYLGQTNGAPKAVYPALSEAIITDQGNGTWLTPTNASGFSMIWNINPVKNYAANGPEFGGALGTGGSITWWLNEYDSVFEVVGVGNCDLNSVFSRGSLSYFEVPEMYTSYGELGYFYPIRLVINDYLPN